MSELIEAHLAHLRAAGRSPNTLRARHDVLHHLHADLPYGLAWASTEEIETWLGRVGWSRWTRYTRANHVRGFYRWVTAAGYLDGDPTAEMARAPQPRCVPNPVSPDELAHALDRAGEPMFTAILLAAAAGLRAAEIAGLRREDVTETVVHVTGKGGDPQVVDTHPAVWAHLRERLPGPVIRNAAGRRVTSVWLSSRARRYFDSIGQPDVHLHRFRHWYATELLDRGASLRLVQEALRHQSITSTQGYTAVRSGQRRHAIATLPIPTGTQQSTDD